MLTVTCKYLADILCVEFNVIVEKEHALRFVLDPLQRKIALSAQAATPNVNANAG